MTVPSRQAVASLLLAAATATHAQTFATQTSPATQTSSAAQTSPAPAHAAPGRRAFAPSTPYINHNLIFLDPAHGGADTGAQLGNQLLEKDITLALANRIRTLLAGNNLTILLAREADAPPSAPAAADPDQPTTPAQPTSPTPDQRAGAANHAHPVACILLHATASGNGVHIVTSPLPPPEISPDALPSSPASASPAPRIIPWESAQADSIAQSLRLANEIGAAVAHANLPVHLSRASVRPIDSLTCPAVAIEIAPLVSGPTPVSNPAYQQRLAEAVATALLFWRGHADPPAPPTPVVLTPADPSPAPAPAHPHATPRPKPPATDPGALPQSKPSARSAPKPALQTAPDPDLPPAAQTGTPPGTPPPGARP